MASLRSKGVDIEGVFLSLLKIGFDGSFHRPVDLVVERSIETPWSSVDRSTTMCRPVDERCRF